MDTQEFQQIDAPLQAHLDSLNAAFAAFKKAEAESLIAEKQQDTERLIHLWYAKNQASQAYMKEWDYLSEYGELIFDRQSDMLMLVPNAGMSS